MNFTVSVDPWTATAIYCGVMYVVAFLALRGLDYCDCTAIESEFWVCVMFALASLRLLVLALAPISVPLIALVMVAGILYELFAWVSGVKKRFNNTT